MSNSLLDDNNNQLYFPIRIKDKVWIKSTSSFWSNIPSVVQYSLIDGAKRIARIRTRIAMSAKVQSMPPVEIVPELWSDSVRATYGKSTILTLDNNKFFGVRLPAQTAVHKDVTTLRSILIHEYSHCFYNMTEVFRQVKTGLEPQLTFDFDPYNDEEDRAHMIDPKEWFSMYDVKEFIYHNSPRMFEPYMNIHDLKDFLPMLTPDLLMDEKSAFCFDDNIVEHIEKLNSFS